MFLTVSSVKCQSKNPKKIKSIIWRIAWQKIARGGYGRLLDKKHKKLKKSEEKIKKSKNLKTKIGRGGYGGSPGFSIWVNWV